MIKIFNTPLLSLICILLSIGMLNSCVKKNDAKSGMVKLLSFGPTGAMHGDTVRFIGYNLDKVTAVKFTGVTVAQSAFIQQNAEMILLLVPQLAEQGFVTLTTPDGDIVSKTRFNLEVPVTVTFVTQEARPGDNITIKGQYLNWVNRIVFSKDIAVDSFVSKSLTEIVVKVPLNAQTGVLVLSSGGTEPMETITDTTLIVTLPVATAISPNPVKHAANLTITGTNLDLATGVMFPGVTAAVTSFVSQSPTQIVVKVPGGATKGKISMVARSMVTTTYVQELSMVLPSATSFSPNPIDSVSNLTITGTNLDLVTGISFTGVLAPVTSFVSQSSTQIVVKTPSGALKGNLVFAVANSSVTVTSSQVLNFTGGLPPLADFPLAIYTDAVQNGFSDGSWAGRDFNSTANVRQGTKSIKATYGVGGYEGIKFSNSTGVATAGYTNLEFSVFGEAGTGGKKLNLVINGNYSSPPQVTIVEGEWALFSVSLTSLGSPAKLTEFVLQSAGWSGVIHIDHVGLR